MNKHSTAGPDGIPLMLLNQCCDNIAEPLSVCFNKSIDHHQGSIPDFLKTAAVVQYTKVVADLILQTIVQYPSHP